MENSKNSIVKNALVLCVITLIAGLCLGVVYDITKEPIEKAKLAANLEAYQAVFPEAADFNYEDSLTSAVKAFPDALASSGLQLGNVVLNEALEAEDASGNIIGYIVSSTSKDGYGGNVTVSVGINLEGTITGVKHLELNETAGLGMKAAEPEFQDQFKDKKVDSFVVTKSGAQADNEIDALSGATITSNAFTHAVNAAVYFVDNCLQQ